MDFKQSFFCYSLQGTDPLSTGITYNSDNDIMPLDTDADFECKRLTCFVNRDFLGDPQTEATRQIPTGMLFNIRDNSTGRTLFNGFADAGELFGDGRIPFVLPTSHFFRRGGQAQVLYADASLQGPDFANAQMWLIMVGVKHYER